MKQGKTLSQLAAEIERQAGAKQDFIAPTSMLEAVVVDPTPRTGDVETARKEVQILKKTGTSTFLPIGAQAHKQIAERLQIPGRYYERMMLEQPELLAENINTWFQAGPEKRMLRVMDGRLRAFLSDKYLRIDNYDVANAVLPVLASIDGVRNLSSEITETRMYIKAVTSKVTRQIISKRAVKGEMVEAGVMVTNSEIGLGAVSVKPYALFLWCTNGAVIDKGMRAAHIGRRVEGEDITGLLSDETKQLEDRAMLAKIKDVVAASFDVARFSAWIDKVQGSTERKIEGNPASAIEELAQVFSFNDGEKSTVMRHFIEGGDLSQFGVMNAITRAAEDLDSYDRATEFEAMGPALIELPAGDWKRIAQAA